MTDEQTTVQHQVQFVQDRLQHELGLVVLKSCIVESKYRTQCQYTILSGTLRSLGTMSVMFPTGGFGEAPSVGSKSGAFFCLQDLIEDIMGRLDARLEDNKQ